MENAGTIYLLLRWVIRRALSIYCPEIRLFPVEVTTQVGPMMLASNHPDSFLDAIIIGSRFATPVYFLARGDAFRKPAIRRVLFALKMIPIYRLSEGREYLALNDATFEQCRQIFLAGGIVLIFSEGLCVHQHDLRPLKKGTARIAIAAVNAVNLSESFRVQPVSITYNSFTRFSKRVVIRFGEPIPAAAIRTMTDAAIGIARFNSALSEKLAAGLAFNRLFFGRSKWSLTRILWLIVLFLPAIAGWILHFPLYIPARSLVKRKTEGTVFYDSVLFGSLLLAYPLYYLILNVVALFAVPLSLIRLFAFAMPAWAWCYARWKRVLNGSY